MTRPMRGSTLVEFALAWPVALVLLLGAVQVALWAGESFAARAAALAGARAGTVAGGSADVAAKVAIRALRPTVLGAFVTASCASPPRSGLEVCARDRGDELEVDVAGVVPALVPLAPDGGLPVSARVVLQKETFAR